MKLLRGDQGHLRLQIRQIGKHIIIENNVFTEPWVIALPSYTNNPINQTNTAELQNNPSNPVASAGDVKVSQIGGSLMIFGGNLSCGINFCHLNYYQNSIVNLKDQKAYGENRSFESRLSLSGSAGVPSSVLADGRFYPNIAQLITDDDGAVNLSLRPGIGFSDFGGEIIASSQLIINTSSVTSGKFSILDTAISLIAGKASCTNGEDRFDYGYCITPVLQYCRQYSPRLKRFVTSSPINIRDIIETIEITREAEDYHSVSSSGSITINIIHPSVNAEARSAIINSIGKARYISIDASHFNCGKNTFDAYRTAQAPGGKVNVGSGGDRRLFTGIAFNPSITDEPGKKYLKFELKDFWTILESKIILNSPYFDGVIDTHVVDFLLKYTGFKDVSGIHGNSRDAMGISFSFNEPNAKFQDKKTISDAIKELARKYSKYAFFNASGRFCYQPFPTNLLTASSGPFSTKFNFFSSHLGRNSNIFPLGPYQAGGAGLPSHNSQIAYGVKTTQWDNKDIYNKLVITSVDARDRGLIVVSDANFDSLTDSESVGYLGYERTFMTEEAAFGDIDRVRKILRYYTRMFRPTYSINWKCYGGNAGVDIFDIVSVDGALIVITKISHTIDAKNNLWETDYTGQWIFPPLVTGNVETS